MKVQDVILGLLDEQGRSRRSLAKVTGMSPQTLDNRLLRNKDIGLDSAVLMLDALGYELVIEPKEPSGGGIRVEPPGGD